MLLTVPGFLILSVGVKVSSPSFSRVKTRADFDSAEVRVFENFERYDFEHDDKYLHGYEVSARVIPFYISWTI